MVVLYCLLQLIGESYLENGWSVSSSFVCLWWCLLRLLSAWGTTLSLLSWWLSSLAAFKSLLLYQPLLAELIASAGKCISWDDLQKPSSWRADVDVQIVWYLFKHTSVEVDLFCCDCAYCYFLVSFVCFLCWFLLVHVLFSAQMKLHSATSLSVRYHCPSHSSYWQPASSHCCVELQVSQ